MQNNDNMNPMGHDDMMNKDGMMDEKCCGGGEGCCKDGMMDDKKMDGMDKMDGDMGMDGKMDGMDKNMDM